MGIVQVEGLLIKTPLTNSRLKICIVELALEVNVAKAFTKKSRLDFNEMDISINSTEKVMNFEHLGQIKMSSPVTGRR